MQGVHGVYSVHPGSNASGSPDDDEVRSGIAIADLAVENGVAHLIYPSGASAGKKLTGVARLDAKPRVEAHIRKLPIIATIVRPMIFMEMLTRPGLGLNEGRFTFFLRPDQSMQLVAVEDIGRFVATIFGDKTRFGGMTLKLASDTVTGRSLQSDLSEAAGHPIAYLRFTEEFLAAHPDLAQITASLENGPLADHVNLNTMREMNSKILSFRSWIARSGRKSFSETLGKVELR